MEKLNCLVVEDQIPAQEILISYIEQVPTLNLQGVYISPLEAIASIEGGNVDILFLDIHLPKLSGIELLKSIKHLPNTILTTAFSDYAVEGFNLDVIDYLLKPFSFDRFLKAVAKVPSSAIIANQDLLSDHLFVKSQGQIKKIEVSGIEYIEAKGDFVIIYSNDARAIANISLTKLQATVGSGFVRCHKSYIVNIASINKIVGNTITVSTQKIPIGRSYKADLMKKLNLI